MTPFVHDNSRWSTKFARAFRGSARAVRGEKSFKVHFAAAAIVTMAATVLGADATEWCLLLLSMATVLSVELLNTSLERMARAVTRDDNPHVADALDIGSAAVLTAALGASAVGSMVFIGLMIRAFR
jgi:undecaprenol kinase